MEAAPTALTYSVDMDGGGGCMQWNPKRLRLHTVGPTSAAAFVEYPAWLWSDMMAGNSETWQEDQSRILRAMSAGIKMYGHFSGLDMYLLQMHSLEKVVRLMHPRFSSGRVENLHARDCDMTPVRYLLALPDNLRPQHLHGNILDRLPDSIMAELHTIRKVVCKDLAQKVSEIQRSTPVSQEALKRVRLESSFQLVENLQNALHAVDFRRSSSYCFVHKKSCKCYPTRYDDHDGDARPFRMATGSSVCCDVSPYGTGEGIFGKGTLPFMVWLMERKAYQEDIIVHENVPRWLNEAFWVVEKLIGHIYRLEVFNLGPDMLGLPQTRTRCFLVGRHRTNVAAARPITLDEFDRFRHLVVMDADELFMAPSSDVEEVAAGIRSAHGLPRGAPLQRHHWLGGSANVLRVLDHVQNDMVRTKLDAAQYATLCRIVNCKQSERMCQMSNLLGSLQRDSYPYSIRKGRPLLPMEMLSAMGVDVWPHLRGNFLSPAHSSIAAAGLSGHEIASLSGNSIHGANLFTVLLVVFGTSVRVPAASLRMLRSFTAEMSDDQDDIVAV